MIDRKKIKFRVLDSFNRASHEPNEKPRENDTGDVRKVWFRRCLCRYSGCFNSIRSGGLTESIFRLIFTLVSL